MRSFTNLDGELIELSDEHLDIAIELKQELKKASPSGRISWAQHKRMMESEGFYESESSENYRCAIKAEQKSRGVLPSIQKHVELISDNKLQSLKDEIGNIRENKLEAQQEFLKLNRMKRNLSKDIVLIESLERALSEKDFGKTSEFKPKLRKSDGKSYMIACISDLHYGAKVEVDGQYYDTELARYYLLEYGYRIIEMAEHNNVEEVHVMNLGDLIEGDSMRASNTYSAEKTFAEQIADSSELIIEFLKLLSGHVKVRYSGIAGNHDRIHKAKDDTIFGSHAVHVSNKIIETYAKYSGDGIVYEQANDYDHIISANNKSFLFVHGDMTAVGRKTILAEQSMVYGINFDALIAGHIHHFTMREVGDDKFVATFGSIKGSDEYSLKQLGTSSSRSQGVIIIEEDGDFEIKKVKL